MIRIFSPFAIFGKPNAKFSQMIMIGYTSEVYLITTNTRWMGRYPYHIRVTVNMSVQIIDEYQEEYWSQDRPLHYR